MEILKGILEVLVLLLIVIALLSIIMYILKPHRKHYPDEFSNDTPKYNHDEDLEKILRNS